MPVLNPSLPVRLNPQDFILVIAVHVDSTSGKVAPGEVTAHLEKPLDTLLGEHLADCLDRDPDRPMPFSYHGATALWPYVYAVAPVPDGHLMVAHLTGQESSLLRAVLSEARNTLGPAVKDLAAKIGIDLS